MTKSGKHCGKRRNCSFLSNFFLCHYVFKKPSAAEASESVYIRERVQDLEIRLPCSPIVDIGVLFKNEAVFVTLSVTKDNVLELFHNHLCCFWHEVKGAVIIRLYVIVNIGKSTTETYNLHLVTISSTHDIFWNT